ncbi:effector-associated constant component EACC1 [Nocardia asiatica]|uniref:effector-associated constant component EACC1 n=1 Tax=Nocardia asiatica TaxID=209252 RepID=UPI003EE366FF
MELTVAIVESDDDVSELRSLYSSFLDDDEIRPLRKRLVAGVPGDGQMGTADDVIALLLDPAFATTAVESIAACITTWLGTRRSKLKIVVRGPGGSAKVVVTSRGPANEADVLRALEIARGGTGEASRS